VDADLLRAALGEIVATWVAIAATTTAFFGRQTAAGALMLPYLAWVTFATALNFEIWRRNR
jgi:translocator protein